ncbi:putative membrane protein, partial [Chlamydia psittaci 01DC11]
LFRIFIKKRYQLFIDIMAIVTFSAILEFLNVIILS